MASHSDARALTEHNRNLSDDMLKILAEKGGVIGINFELNSLEMVWRDRDNSKPYQTHQKGGGDRGNSGGD